ncbi:MAG: chemotaxis protein CheD [Planctomycetes bacterium]|nr:chemotaxis protein CheD [Planctomycetota bacterium]
MSTTVLTKKKTEANVGMSQVVMLEEGELAKSVLGSCIGLVLYHERRKIAAVCHIVLPESLDRPGPPGKFADTAIPHMLELLVKQGGNRAGLIAKLAGGSNMFGSNGPLQIGEANYNMVKDLLEELGIPLVGKHIGGEKGRRILFDSQTGELKVEMMGEPAVIL